MKLTARYEAIREFLNFEYSPVLKRFMPEKPWHGGPPQSSSTSPFCGNLFPLCMGSTPSMTFLRRRLQSSVKTVHEGLFFLKALAAGSQTSMAQWESATPAWNKNNLIDVDGKQMHWGAVDTRSILYLWITARQLVLFNKLLFGLLQQITNTEMGKCKTKWYSLQIVSWFCTWWRPCESPPHPAKTSSIRSGRCTCGSEPSSITRDSDSTGAEATLELLPEKKLNQKLRTKLICLTCWMKNIFIISNSPLPFPFPLPLPFESCNP